MSKYRIINIPDPVLKQVALPVDKIDSAIKAQMNDMLEAMYDAPGIGLAANQVGLLNRVLVMDLSNQKAGEAKEPICMANPEIVWESEDLSNMEEGCLSIPQQYGDVSRPAEVKVKYFDQNGDEQLLEADGLLSHCVQHEIDHLDGILFIDYLSSLKRNMIVKKVQKLRKQGVII